MNQRQSICGTVILLLLCHVCPAQDDEMTGEPLFNGKDLTGWMGDLDIWSVQDGAITGQTTADKPLQANTFLIWQGGSIGDFELELDYRIVAGNSGIQYRSQVIDADNWSVGGYQADIEAGDNYSGILYDERGRGKR